MRIAVTGGTGRIGAPVVQLLSGDGRHDVVPLSSRTAPYDDPAALRAALDGADTLVFVSSDGEAARVVVHHRNVLDAAIRCGVGHVVLLSGLDADVYSRSAIRSPTATPSGCSAPPASRTPSCVPACSPSSSSA